MLATMLVTLTTTAIQVLMLSAVIGLGMVGILLLPWTEAEQTDTIEGLHALGRGLQRAIVASPRVLSRRAASLRRSLREPGPSGVLLPRTGVQRIPR